MCIRDRANRVLSEGIKSLFNIKNSTQSDPIGSAIIKIVESYELDKGYPAAFRNTQLRLIGSNVNGGLMPNYIKIIVAHRFLLGEFIAAISPGLDVFFEKTMNDGNKLIDEILDARL